MANVKETVLKFVVQSTGNPRDVLSRFHPHGKDGSERYKSGMAKNPVLHVTSVKNRATSLAARGHYVWDVEVSYRPKGCVSRTSAIRNTTAGRRWCWTR